MDTEANPVPPMSWWIREAVIAWGPHGCLSAGISVPRVADPERGCDRVTWGHVCPWRETSGDQKSMTDLVALLKEHSPPHRRVRTLTGGELSNHRRARGTRPLPSPATRHRRSGQRDQPRPIHHRASRIGPQRRRRVALPSRAEANGGTEDVPSMAEEGFRSSWSRRGSDGWPERHARREHGPSERGSQHALTRSSVREAFIR
jgi:hypothetical protein